MESFSRKRKLVELNKNITPSERQLYYKASVSTDGNDYNVSRKYQRLQPMLELTKVPPRSYSVGGRYERNPPPEESKNPKCGCAKYSDSSKKIYICTCTNSSGEPNEWYPPEDRGSDGSCSKCSDSSNYREGQGDWDLPEDGSMSNESCDYSKCSEGSSETYPCNCGNYSNEWTQPEERRTDTADCSNCSGGSTDSYSCNCRNYQWSVTYGKSTNPMVRDVLQEKPFRKMETIVEANENEQETEGSQRIVSVPRGNLSSQVELINDNDRRNTKMWFTTDYIEDIVTHELYKESCYRLSESFCKKYDINPTGREILIDWLINVQVHLKAENSALHLAVALLDILLDSIHVPLQELQAAAVAAFWVAYKFYHGSISIKTLLSLCAGSVTKEMIEDHEILVIQTSRLIQAGGSLTVFFNYLLFKIFGFKFPPDVYYCGLYFIEIMLLQFVFIDCPAYEKATTAVYTAMELFNYSPRSEFPEVSKFITKNKLHQLSRRLMRFIKFLYKDKEILKNSSVYRKYKSSRYMKISIHTNLKSLSGS